MSKHSTKNHRVIATQIRNERVLTDTRADKNPVTARGMVGPLHLD